MPTAQMKGESPNCRNHRVLPIPADGLYWGAVGIKSCLYVTHITLHKGKIFMPTAQMRGESLIAVITGFYPSLLTDYTGEQLA